MEPDRELAAAFGQTTFNESENGQRLNSSATTFTLQPMAFTSSESMCQMCWKPAGLQTPMKRCARCKAVVCCSKDCQTVAWPTYKETCKKPGASTQIDDRKLKAEAEKLANASPLTRAWSSMSQKKVMQLIIDAYRFRVEDDYAWKGEHHGLYADPEDPGDSPIEDFREFLDKAEKKNKKHKILPDWWSKTGGKECERLAVSDQWSHLHYAVEKADIQKHYDYNMMPMMLRLFAEDVYGTSIQHGGVGGSSAIRGMLGAMES